MMTLKEYAEDQGVSYEAVRQQVKRYETELADHIEKKGRVQLLDDYAVNFLTEKRNAQPIVIVNRDQTDHIKELEKKLAVAEALYKQRDKDVEKALNLASERLQEISNLKHLEKENERLETALNDSQAVSKGWESEAIRLEKEKEELKKEVEFLKNRGFFARLLNKTKK